MVKGFQECSVMLTLLEDLWPHQNTPDVEKKTGWKNATMGIYGQPEKLVNFY